jgi:hypothetical protein
VRGMEYTGELAGGADIAISELGTDATDFQMVELSVDDR